MQYTLRFINIIVNGFINSTKDLADSYNIPLNLFEEQKPFILIEMNILIRNENKSKNLTRKSHEFTKNKFKISTKWIAKKTPLFSIKRQKYVVLR